MKSINAVVTGGTKGIGLGIAESLLKRNAFVAITYHGDDVAAEEARRRLAGTAGDERKIMLLKGSVGDEQATIEHYEKVAHELGPITVLVNNAGQVVRQAFEDITMADWNHTLQVNLSGAFHWCSLVVPGMKKEGYGRIVNISSIAARGGGVVGPHYAASKAGMLGLTRFAARELGQYGITVNAIAPAFIEDASIFTSWTEAQKAELRNNIYARRLGKVSDVVRAFEYLLDTEYDTGVALDVNGGAFMI